VNDEAWARLTAVFVRYRTGDRAAAIEVYRPIAAALERFFAVRTGSVDDARDLTQATLLKMHLARDRYDAAQSLKTWVFTIASRALIDLWRAGKDKGPSAEAAADPDDLAGEFPSHGRILEYGDALAKALATLQPTDRTIVYLSGVEGLSMAEIAHALSISESAAKTRAHRSYVKLRALLGDEDHGRA
jgi:RNA polymerase sigma-70 factor (ECF subfamily)